MSQGRVPVVSPDVAAGKSSRRVVTVLVTVVALVVALTAGWWAARATLEPETVQEAESTGQVVWAEATSGSVGRSLPLSTTLRQPSAVVAVNQLSGVVTQTSPGQVEVGDVVYAVAGVPVRAVEGGVPFYRDLTRGTRGTDVGAAHAVKERLRLLLNASDAPV